MCTCIKASYCHHLDLHIYIYIDLTFTDRHHDTYVHIRMYIYIYIYMYIYMLYVWQPLTATIWTWLVVLVHELCHLIISTTYITIFYLHIYVHTYIFVLAYIYTLRQPLTFTFWTYIYSHIYIFVLAYIYIYILFVCTTATECHLLDLAHCVWLDYDLWRRPFGACCDCVEVWCQYVAVCQRVCLPRPWSVESVFRCVLRVCCIAVRERGSVSGCMFASTIIYGEGASVRVAIRCQCVGVRYKCVNVCDRINHHLYKGKIYDLLRE